MKLYFYFSVHEPLFHEVAKRLRDAHGVDAIGGLTCGRDQADYLRSTGFDWYRIDVMSDWLRESQAETLDIDFLARAEKRYGLPNLARAIFADRHLSPRYDHDALLRIAQTTIKRFEEAFERDRPDAIFVESIDGMTTMLMYGVAKAMGVPMLHLDSGRIERRVAVTRDHLMTWSDVDQAFAARRTGPLSAAEHARAQTFVDDFRSRKSRVQNVRRWMYPRPRWEDLGRIAKAAGRFARDPKNPVLINPAAMVRQKAVRLANHWRSSRFHYFEDPVPGERYVLFPLHYQPEVSTLVLGQYYLDQVALIGDIARSLPVGYRLYVKEHYFAIGRRSPSEYSRIKALYNVRMIGPMHDAFQLVAGAGAVATISGTMGWEGVLMERPVLTFGDCFYNTYPQVVRLGAKAKIDWPAEFERALRDFRPDHELLLKYVAAILDKTYEGYFSFDNPTTDPERAMREENFVNIANVIATELGLTAHPSHDRGAA